MYLIFLRCLSLSANQFTLRADSQNIYKYNITACRLTQYIYNLYKSLSLLSIYVYIFQFDSMTHN